MIQRKTQSPVYWESEFKVVADDLQYLGTLLVDEELPRSAEELGGELILHRCRQEETLVERAMQQGTPYQPKRSYKKKEKVIFPALGYQVGTVTDVRAGNNPEFDPFKVIQVTLEDGEKREFAAELETDHPLNAEPEAISDKNAAPLSPEEISAQYGSRVGQLVEEHLEADPSFVRLAGKWFPKDLLVDVHIGHLNLAEAVLDMGSGGPLPTDALLGDLELPEEITPQLRVFSLNYALQEDERFDEVGPAGQVLWFLRRLEPEHVQSTPRHLQCQIPDYDPALLTSEMVALERDLDDEWSDGLPAPEQSEPASIVLTYPHWKAGTLPISSRLAPILPTGRTYRIRFTFVDGLTGEEMPGWVVREGRYVYGLHDWYREKNIPPGAYLELSHGDEPGTTRIQPRGRRARREWVRVALPMDNRLTFEMRKELIACEYDELMIVTEEDAEVVDAVRAHVAKTKPSLAQLVADIFPELAKLSPQGTVHAATLYSAANVALRMPPGPLLAELVASDAYVPVGDNYWILQLDPGEI